MTTKLVQVGTLESNDIHITIEIKPVEYGIQIELQSEVLAQYGDDIMQSIRNIITQSAVIDGLHIVANDKGALNCTIEARMKTALMRLGLLEEVTS